jgi:hypothetical protein
MTTLVGVGNTYSASAGDGTITIQYLADALPAGTVIDGYLLSDTSNAVAAIGTGNTYVMSLVLAWLAPDGTVPSTANGKAISMAISNASIKRGAKIYNVMGSQSTLIGVAAVDGSVTVSITDDPQIFVAITRPDAPVAVTAISGRNASTTVSWSAPATNGGSEITSYTVTSNTGKTCTSITTSCSMIGLTNGTPYTFTVVATNGIGISSTSVASASATPAAPSSSIGLPAASGSSIGLGLMNTGATTSLLADQDAGQSNNSRTSEVEIDNQEVDELAPSDSQAMTEENGLVVSWLYWVLGGVILCMVALILIARRRMAI